MSDDLDPMLRAAISDAVDDVEPTDRLAAIRLQTRGATVRRRGWYAAGGSLLVAAAAVTVAVVATGPDGTRAADPASGPTTSAPTAPATDPPTSPAGPAPEATDAPSGTTEAQGELRAIYYLGAGPDGPDAPGDVLFRSFERGAPGDSGTGPLDLLMRTPSDPDYRTLWPAGSLVGVSDPEAGMVFVRLDDQALRDRPAGMTEREAELSVQAVVYTLQASFQEQVAVQFTLGDNPVDQVFGVPTSEPLARADALDVLSHMMISTPAEGSTVSGSFAADGQGNSFEATGNCSLLDRSGETVVGPLIAMMTGWMEPRLFPWELTVDLSDVPPGTYTFACITDDPTGGAEGRGTDTDTRTVIVE